MTESPNVHQRLAAAMGEVDYIQKEKKQGMQYTIVSHDAVTAKVRPALLKHGVIYYPVALSHAQNGNRTEVALTVRFANIDEPQDYIDVPGLGYGNDPQDKGPGKAISYAVKYCLLKALGLETGDDPDTENVDYVPPKQSAPADEWPLFDADGMAVASFDDPEAFTRKLGNMVPGLTQPWEYHAIRRANLETLKRLPKEKQDYLAPIFAATRQRLGIGENKAA